MNKLTFKIITLGCKVNQYETQLLREMFERNGLECCENTSDADICIINTCTVTHTADSKSRNVIRKIIKDSKKEARVFVTGCATTLNAEELLLIEGVDSVVLQDEKQDIAKYLPELDNPKSIFQVSHFSDKSKAFVKIQDGCNRFCSYCKVPLVRGRSRSRNSHEIISEVKELIKNGYHEIILTGICLGDYGKDFTKKLTLAQLLAKLSVLEGQYRLRLSSIQPCDVTDELIDVVAEFDTICHHFHLSLQSGDDVILEKMNRHYSSEFFIDRYRTITKKIPQCSITTDVIVGFPGESSEHFSNTCRVLEEINVVRIHAFPYSVRENTKAAVLCKTERVAQEEIKSRIAELALLSKKTFKLYAIQFLGYNVQVLVEQKKENGYEGYSREYLPVSIQTDEQLEIGKLYDVEVVTIHDSYVIGKKISVGADPRVGP